MGLVYTSGFHTARDLNNHFVKHGGEFGCTTEDDYETMADEFIGRKLESYMDECSQKSAKFDSRIQRFCTQSNNLGVRTDIVEITSCRIITYYLMRGSAHGNLQAHRNKCI